MIPKRTQRPRAEEELSVVTREVEVELGPEPRFPGCHQCTL